MSRSYLSSDWHLGHKGLHKFGRRPCATVKDNYDFIGDHYNLTKRDTLILLGDIIFEEEAFSFIQSLTAMKKVLIIGNHDWERFNASMFDVAKTFDSVHGVISYGKGERKSWLSHFPIHPEEFRKKHYNIHGHLHEPENSPVISADSRYINVNVDALYPSEGVIMKNFQDLFKDN